MHHLQLVEAQREVQDLGELLGQGLLPLQVLGGVVVGLAGQSAQEAAQRCFCEGGGGRRGTETRQEGERAGKGRTEGETLPQRRRGEEIQSVLVK